MSSLSVEEINNFSEDAWKLLAESLEASGMPPGWAKASQRQKEIELFGMLVRCAISCSEDHYATVISLATVLDDYLKHLVEFGESVAEQVQ